MFNHIPLLSLCEYQFRLRIMFKTSRQSPRLRHVNCGLQLHEINRPLTRSQHPAHAQAILARRNEPRHALERLAFACSAARAVAKTGRPPFNLAMMLRIHCLQQWFSLSDSRAEEALFENRFYRDFVGISGTQHIPDRVSTLRFRHLLEDYELSPKVLQVINAKLAAHRLLLKAGTVVDATLSAAPGSTKNKTGERDPEMHQVKKGNQRHLGMKAQFGVDAESGWVDTVIGTAANVNDVTQGHALLHSEEQVVFADAGYQGFSKRPDAIGVDWRVAMRPGERRAQKHPPWGSLHEQGEQLKASVRAKVEHPFRVIKRQFGCVKVRYRELAKNTAQFITLFALSNIWMARSRLMQSAQG